MKKIFTLVFLSLICLSSNLNAQGYVNYNRNWFFGLNFGGTYHSNTEVEVNGLYRAGVGFTFGRSFNYDKGNLLSWDLRVRYLFATYRGLSNEPFALDSTNYNVLNLGYELQQYQTAYGYYVPNFRSRVNDWSLELQLNTNLLREKTGWNLFVFGGIGNTQYLTETDLYDNDISFQIKPEDKLSEKGVNLFDYETKVVKRNEWMPSFGAGISKQITPNISFELMGRMTWTRNNDFDAMPYNFDGSSSKNDRYHYASAGFNFALGGGGSGHGNYTDDGTSNNTNNLNNNNNTNVVRQKPVVDFTNPSGTPYTTSQSTFYIKANVYYVDGAQNVKFIQDGVLNNAFTFNANTNEFAANVQLHDGENVFELTGTNQYGSDFDKVVIIKKNTITKNPPVVTFTNPSTNPQTVAVSSYNFSGIVLNVDGKDDITVTFNGQNISNFVYNSSTHAVTTLLNLNLGSNVITVTGVNQDGQDTETATIIYARPTNVQPPVVDITNPSVNPYGVSSPAYTVQATVKHVIDKNHVTVLFNGVSVSNFSYNTVTDLLLFPISNLNVGTNLIEVIGTNNDGQAKDQVKIIYNETHQATPPTVTFINPNVPGTTVGSPSYVMNAITTHIDSKSQIVLKHNGNVISANSYTFANSQITYPLNLSLGLNTFDVTVTNNDGTANAQTSIIYKKEAPCLKPKLTAINPLVTSITTDDNTMSFQFAVSNMTTKTVLKVTKNGANVPFNFNPNTNVLSVTNANLVDGVNTFEFSVSNKCGGDKIIITVRKNRCKLPVISFSSPTNVTNAGYALSAIVTNIDNANLLTLTLNGQAQFFNFNQNTGAITANLQLQSGSNTIVINANKCDGATKKLVVNYTPPCNVPVISVTSGNSTNTAVYNFAAHVTNVSAGSDIELKLNGNVVNSSFNSSNGNVTASLTLNEGNNTIILTANGCETVSSTVVVNYEKPCVSPVITANVSSDVTSSSYNLVANVTNIENGSDVSVSLNGTVVSSNFNTSTGALTSTLSLTEGTNTIVITANGCTTATKVLNINYTVPCDTPTITVTSSTTSTSNTYNLVVMIGGNVSQSDLVVVSNGGMTQTGWTDFNKNLHKATATISLVDGENTIVVTINGCETVTETIIVDYTAPCNSPAITVSSGTSATASAYSLNANVTNVDNASGVTVTLNGATVSSTYVPSTGSLTANITLVEGANTIVITANGCSTETKTVTVNYTAPCNSPVITVSSGTSATASAYNLNANVTNVDNASGVTVTLNGGTVSSTFVPSTGSLTANMTLVEGTNTIVITANGCSTETKTVTVNYTAPCNSPAITVSSGTSATASAYNLNANVTNVDNASGVTVTLNGATVSSTYVPSTGSLTANMTLVEGTNTIVITANGCSTETKTVTVNYTAPCNSPAITVSSGTLATASAYSLNANVTNVDNASGVTVTLNGATVSSTYVPSTGSLTANMTLVEGANTIVITANGCSTETKTVTVNYTAPCNSPAITVSSGTSATASAYNLNANVTNVDNASGVTVTLNGATVSSTYVPSTGSLTANMTLVEGANTIVITANGCSTETKTVTVNYTAPCNSPVITVSSSQAIPSSNVSSSAYSLNANVTNVDNASGVTVTLNGATVSSTYVPSTGSLTANMTLVEGTNTIVITANGCSTETKTVTVNYTAPCNSPAITVSSGTSATASAYSLNANVTNVDNASGVTVTLNGTTVSSTFVPSTGSLTANMTLVEGTNTIVITANGCSTETKTVTVNYTAPQPAGPCGPRFNPGNSDWEFCLITPTGTYNRDDLANNPSFTYSGSASSLFFKPIAGGGDAVVNGSPYALQNGKYYLFTGNLTVDVSSSHPGSMGHWEVCLTSSSTPTYGIGNNRPVSPCEPVDNGKGNGNGNNGRTMGTPAPNITLVAPKTTTVSVTAGTYLFKAKVEHVKSKSGVEVFVNGIKQTSIMYSTSTGLVTAVIKLKRGQNTVKVVGKNESGSDSQDYIITYTPSTNSGTKSTGTKSTGTKSTGTKSTSTGTKSTGTKSTNTGTKSTDTKSTNTKSTGTKSTGTKSTGTKSTGTKSTGTKSTGTKSTGTKSTETKSTEGTTTRRG